MVTKKRNWTETAVFLIAFLAFAGYIAKTMGLAQMFSTVMKTAFDLLINTAFYVMSICVLAGALSSLFAEFGVVDLMQKAISPIMRPIFGLPGVASLGVITTFLSDNPAILPLGQDGRISKYFKKYEVASLTNLGTAFGMGLIIFSFMAGLGYAFNAIIGIAGASFGALVSTRMMLFLTKRFYKKNGQWEEQNQFCADPVKEMSDDSSSEAVKASYFERFLSAMLDGGKGGVDIGLSVIPGILCVTSIVMIITFGPGPEGVYTGKAYEGVAILPKVGEMIAPVTDVLFGFKDPSNIAFPLTSLGAVGAALGTLPKMIAANQVGGNEISVFTAMGMCWSGYLSTHVSMMDSLQKRDLLQLSLASHTVAGLCAGIFAHYLFLLVG